MQLNSHPLCHLQNEEVFLQMWNSDKPYQNHLEYRFSGPILQQLNQNLLGWSPTMCIAGQHTF